MTYTKQTFVDYNTCCNTSWDTTKCMMNEPTLPPSYAPTLSPSTARPTPLTTCPPPYDVNEQYSPGSQVEVNYVIYQCLPIQKVYFATKTRFNHPMMIPDQMIRLLLQVILNYGKMHGNE